MTPMQISIRLGLAATLLLVGTSAGAQQQPPPAGAPPAATAPPPPVAPVPGPEAPSAPGPAAAAPATAATTTTAPSTLAPEPAPTGPALSLEQRTTLPEQEARPQPFYEKLWFWGAVGFALGMTAVILVSTAGSAGPATPNTTLGNMNAY
jgi:hypothetical protein